MLRDARKQSGVGWIEERSMIQAEPHLWDNLEIVSSFILPTIGIKFGHKFYHIDIHLSYY
jgi:hypothetical protein